MKSMLLTLIIWIVCLTAITVGGALTYEWYLNRGPVISISFNDSSGLVPGQSKIIYRGVLIGQIIAINLDADTGKPIVVSRITKQAEALLGKDSKFWLVRPEIELGKISNLSAIATGNYIAALPVKGKFVDTFKGLDDVPLDPKFEQGLELYLRSSALNGVGVQSPILYHGLQIGEIGNMELTRDRKDILLTISIYKEFRSVVRRSSYFVNQSGLHASVHLFGESHIDMPSISTLIHGGISIFTPDLSAPAARKGSVFKVLSSEEYEQLQDS